MSDFTGSDLYKRVERYEAAVDELRATHEDIKDVLAEHVLHDRWRLLGADLGFAAVPLPERRALRTQPERDLVAVADMHKINESWES
jgi:hypothetical protein